MDKQNRLLDKDYIETRLMEFAEIKRGEIKYLLYESNRALSKTLYIAFLCEKNCQWVKHFTIRISDHFLNDCVHLQFIIDPFAPLTKTKKAQFVKIVQRAISKSKARNFVFMLNEIKGGE